jgi:hypothetical protein
MAGRYVLLTQSDDGCIGVIRRVRDREPDGVKSGLAGARHQQRRSARDDFCGDRGDLGRRFA